MNDPGVVTPSIPGSTFGATPTAGRVIRDAPGRTLPLKIKSKLAFAGGIPYRAAYPGLSGFSNERNCEAEVSLRPSTPPLSTLAAVFVYLDFPFLPYKLGKMELHPWDARLDNFLFHIRLDVAPITRRSREEGSTVFQCQL